MKKLIIAKAGYDINTAEPYELSYNSEYDALKRAVSDSGISAGSDIIIEHNLGYNPIVYVYVESIYHTGEFVLSTGDVSSGMGWIEYTDLNNITLKDIPSGKKYYYYIYYDESFT